VPQPTEKGLIIAPTHFGFILILYVKYYCLISGHTSSTNKWTLWR